MALQRLGSYLVRHGATTLKLKLDEVDGSMSGLDTRVHNIENKATPIRKKTEVYYSGLSLAIPTTETNLIELLKTLTPTSGTLSQFFNTVSNKLNVYNDDATVVFKINISGSWTTATPNRNMRLNFLGTNGNTLIASRNDASITPEVVNFQIFFSIDKDGNIATNGTAPVIQSYGSVFTATSILLIAEQITAVASINPV